MVASNLNHLSLKMSTSSNNDVLLVKSFLMVMGDSAHLYYAIINSSYITPIDIYINSLGIFCSFSYSSRRSVFFQTELERNEDEINCAIIPQTQTSFILIYIPNVSISYIVKSTIQ
jgi:hypothetical protein